MGTGRFPVAPLDDLDEFLAEQMTDPAWRRSAQRARDLAGRLRQAGRPLCADEHERRAVLFDQIADSKERR